ncbi:MAG: inositol monophosphatase family protein, partial [Pseudomonadota bacterium]
MGVYRRGDPSAAIEAAAKADASPVTEADLAADALIAEGLAEAYPAIAAVTEEQVASQGIRPEGAFFLVDPLDGTKEFVQR